MSGSSLTASPSPRFPSLSTRARSMQHTAFVTCGCAETQRWILLFIYTNAIMCSWARKCRCGADSPARVSLLYTCGPRSLTHGVCSCCVAMTHYCGGDLLACARGRPKGRLRNCVTQTGGHDPPTPSSHHLTPFASGRCVCVTSSTPPNTDNNHKHDSHKRTTITQHCWSVLFSKG